MVRSHRTPVPLLPPGRHRGIAVQGQTAFAPPVVPGLVAWYDANQATVPALSEAGVTALAPVAWYDFSDLSTLDAASDTDPITTVTDKSGNGVDLSTTSSSTGPLRTDAALNGLSVATFDGTDDFLKSTANASDWTNIAGNDGPYTVFMVVKAETNAGSGGGVGLFSDTDADTSLIWSYISAGTSYFWHCFRRDDAAATDAGLKQINGVDMRTSYQIQTLSMSGTTVSPYRLGTAVATFTDNVSTLTPTYIQLAANRGPSSYTKMEIAEIIVFDSALSNLNRVGVENYLADKWGLTVTGAPRLTGDPVQLWRDLSGNGNHVTQTTAASKPTWVTGQLNGNPVVRFDGTDDQLRNAAFALDEPLTMVVVYDASADTADFRMLLCDTSAPPYLTIHPTDKFYYGGSGGTGPVATTADDGDVATGFAVIDGASSILYVDGESSPSAVDTGGLSWAGLTVGGYETGTSYPWPGDIAEIIIYNSALSAGDINRLGFYLKTKYGSKWTTI